MRWRIRPDWGKAARSVTTPALRFRLAKCMRSIEAPSLARGVVLLAAFATIVMAQDASPPNPYAGSEACATCHEDISTAFANSPHHTVETDKKRAWLGRACESC